MKKINEETLKSKCSRTYYYNVKKLNCNKDDNLFRLNLYENIFITNKEINLSRDNLLLSMNNYEDIQKIIRLEKLVDDYYELNFKFKDDAQQYVYFNEKDAYTGRIELNWEYRAYDNINLSARVLYFFFFLFKTVFNDKFRKFEIYKLKNKLILTIDNKNSASSKKFDKLYMII